MVFDHFCFTRLKQERIRASQNTITAEMIANSTTENQLENSFYEIMSTEFCMYVQATLLALVFIFGMAR